MVTSTDRRGAEVAAEQLGRELNERGLAVTTVALWPGPAGSASLDLPTLGRRRRDPGALVALARRARPAGLLVGHGSSTLPFGAAAATAVGTPFVYRSIGDPTYWATSRAQQIRVGAALRRAARVVALWPAAADVLVRRYRLDAGRLRVIPTGVATDGFVPTDPSDRPAARRALIDDAVPGGAPSGIEVDRPLIAYLGSLSEEKDPMLAVEAMAEVRGAQLVMAGSGPLGEAVARRAEVVAPGRVHLIGSLAQPARLLAAADALVLPSRTEGLPAAAIEAGLAGLAVVACGVGGMAEVVVDGETGLLVHGRNAGDLADALARVVGPDGPTELGLALGRLGRVRGRARFGLDVVANQWTDLLGDVLDGEPGPGPAGTVGP